MTVSKVVQAILDIHAAQAKAGIVGLANPREGYNPICFHKQEEVYDNVKLSETKVLHSNAGYYIGHESENDDGLWEPYDRISGYYSRRDMAQTDLDEFEKALGR